SGDVLVTQTGKGANMSQLAWFDRSGKPDGTVGQPGWYDNVRLSPDGRRVATDQTDPDGRNIDVWVHELSRDTATRLTFDPALDQTPVWSADSQKVLFTSNRGGTFALYLKNADGSGSEQQLVDYGGALANAWDWSRDDGKELFYMSADGKIMAVPVSTGTSFQAGTPVALFQTHRRQPMSSQDLFSYDVSSNGQKFLIATKLDEPSAAPLSVLLNWA